MKNIKIYLYVLLLFAYTKFGNVRVEQVLEESGVTIAPPPHAKPSTYAALQIIQHQAGCMHQEDQDDESEDSGDTSSGDGSNSTGVGNGSDREDIKMKHLTVSGDEVSFILIIDSVFEPDSSMTIM